MAGLPSKIFVAYRALGYVSNHVPFVTRYHKRHKDNYVITCVGRSFHVYNISKLGIVSVSDSHPEDIGVVAADFKFVFTASGNRVFAVTRNKKIEKEYVGHKADVSFLLPFGRHLVSVDVNGFLFVWDIKSQEPYLQMLLDPASFLVTAVCHPHTYMNKILLGSQQGRLQLWNIKANKLVYTFNGWGSAVTALQQSTAIDVIAIGLADGQIILHNLALDKTVMKFKQDYGPVTCISFRSDGHPMMVSGSTSGHIALWDLEHRKLHSYLKDAHFASVSGLTCLPSEPLMVTSAADNSLKVWIFDLADGGARLLRHREGHSAPPSCIHFYGNDGQNILSAGQDSTLRSFSTVHDKHNKSLGRASHHKKATKRAGLKYDKHKMPAIVQFAAEPSRESDWDNILATHRSLSKTTTWSFQRCTMGKFSFQHQRFSTDATGSITATGVDISSCGNYGLIAYSSGHVDMYNLQSGELRGSFGDPRAHGCTVRGVSIDGLNQKVITAGSDGTLKFWKFKSRQLLGQIKMEAYVSQIVLHRDSSMLAVALDDFTISIVDIDTRRSVRHFSGHTAAISDISFRSDGRWLVSAGMDCSIRTWNLPTGRLIDAFAVQEAPTSVSMSPCGNFLASTHVGNVGVYLWSNRTLYTHVSLSPLPADYEPRLTALPATVVLNSDAADNAAPGEEGEEDGDDDYKSPEQLADELVTLSLLPTSRWLNLLHLDIIRMRNKPKEAPKVPKSAPFFLPTVAGLEPKFEVTKEDSSEKKVESHLKRPELRALSDLAQLLTKAHNNKLYSDVLAGLKEMGPSTIDTEIRLLSPDDGGSEEVLSYFLEFIEATLKTNKDYELAHSYLALFLKVHGEEVSKKPALSTQLERLSSAQFQSWRRVEELLQKSLGLVAYLRSATV